MVYSRESSLEVQASKSEDETCENKKPVDSKKADQSHPAGDVTVASGASLQKQRTDWIALPNQPRETYLDRRLKPISGLPEAFEDITFKAMKLGLGQILDSLAGRSLKVATMCSGTESPIVALDLIRDCLKDIGHDLQFEHVFSSEIVPWKQTWILRNFEPKILFRDITEMNEGEAMTVFGEHAQIPAPGSVHMLVAGFACVDFSLLNNKRKDLVVNLDEIPPEQLLSMLGGESSVTLAAILKYARQYRPPIMILENILGASWAQITNLLLEIDYSVGVAKLDTKHFYIPQTRQRGYLVCISNKKTKGVGGMSKSVADEAVRNWARILNNFMRPASSPVDDFLYKDNHPELIRSLRNLAKESGTQWETDFAKDWSVCWARYQRFREAKGLGNRAPYTHWRSGKVRPPENAQALWLQKQPNRIKDTFDCLYLLSALYPMRNYDASYKARFPDASQNIDRSMDMAKPGIVGCITPNNIIFHTAKGRPPVGLELLKLQGLDPDRLLISRETQRQLKDLAGNAMTTTVVGSAMLSALIAAFEAIDPGTWGELQYKTEFPWPGDKFSFDCRSELVTAQRLDFGPTDLYISTQHFCELAARTVRRCYCEGSWDTASASISQCRDCGHTSCGDCGGNPVHSYQILDDQKRYDPRVFVKTAFQFLPTRLGLENFGQLKRLVLDTVNAMIVKEKLLILSEEFQIQVEENAKKPVPFKGRSATTTESQPTSNAKRGRKQKAEKVSVIDQINTRKAARTLPKVTTESHPEDIIKDYSSHAQQGPQNDKIVLGQYDPAQHTFATAQTQQHDIQEENMFQDAILKFDFQNEELKMTLPERSHYWTIIYESENLKLKLILGAEEVEWLLYVKPASSLAAGSEIRRILEQPIASMRPNITSESSSIWDGDWYAQIYDRQDHIIRINAHGSKVPSWKAELGLKVHQNEEIYDHISIYTLPQDITSSHHDVLQQIHGSYKLLPLCGTATRALHRLTKSGKLPSRPTYLFLSSLPNQPSSEDEFIIGYDHERAHLGESPRYLARITDPKVRSSESKSDEAERRPKIPRSFFDSLSQVDRLAILQSLTNANETVHRFNPDLKKISSKSASEPIGLWRPSLKPTQKVKIAIDYRSERFEGNLQPVNDKTNLCMTVIAPEAITNPFTFLESAHRDGLEPSKVNQCGQEEGLLLKYTIPWYGRNPNGRRHQEPCLITELNQWHMQLDLEWLINRIDLSPELKMWNSIDISDYPNHCQSCSPSLPAYVNRQMPTGGLMPMEDPEAVIEFLEVWKKKPCPLTIAVRRQESSGKQQDLCVTVNIKCLLHRVLAMLPKLLRDGYEKLEASWRISTDVELDRGTGQIGSLKVHDCTREAPLLYSFGSSGFSLRGDQARVFRWMKERDSIDTDPFREVVVEECVSTHLRWSVEAQVTRTGIVRGGLCADHVGFGKTVVVLAIIKEHMHQAREEVDLAIERGLKTHIPVRATLVLVPGSLTFQWAEEIEKFWNGCSYILINSMADLRKLSVRDIENADIVIASVDMLLQDKDPRYTSRIAEIAGVADPAPFTLPRQYLEWSKSVNEKVSSFVQDLQNSELSQSECVDNLRERSYEYRFTTAQHLDPSKRLRGKKLISDQKAQIRGGNIKYLLNYDVGIQRARIPGEVQGFGSYNGGVSGAAKILIASSKRRKLIVDEDTVTDQNHAEAEDKSLESNTPHSQPKNLTESQVAIGQLPPNRKRDARGHYKLSIPPSTTTKNQEKNFHGPVLSMFHFHRKVIDEISYLTPYQEMAIKSVPSNVTWLLSGTARLRDPMDVKRLAAMIGVFTGPDDDSIGHNIEGNRKAVDDNRSDPEKIEASKVVHTDMWHKRRLLIAQTFLDRFARTNQVELPPTSRIRVKEIIWPLRLPALHSALYHECRALLLSEGFKDNVSFTGHGKHDRSIRVSFVLHNTTTIEEALIKTAYFVPRSEGYSMMQHRCHELSELDHDQVLEARADDVLRLTRAVIRRADSFVYWLENYVDGDGLDKKELNFLLDVVKRTIWLLNTRLINGLQDSDASDQLHRIHSKYSLLTTEYPDMVAKEARRKLDRLGKLVDAMVSAVRSLRFLRNAKRLQEMAWGQDAVSFVDDAGHVTSLKNARLNGLCGHLSCETCVSILEEPKCPIVGCGAGGGPELYIHADDLGESCPDSTWSSEKIQTTINIIKALRKDSQALIFCQWHDINEILVYYLEKAGISATYIREGEQTTAQKVSAFKNLPYGHPNWMKVMVLNPLSATAAGHNLQNVNAIIFLTPLSGSSLDDYKAAYIQAIGRAARFGQKDIVKVYHLLVSRTVEVNIHESRRKSKLCLNNDQLIECGSDEIPSKARELAMKDYSPNVPE